MGILSFTRTIAMVTAISVSYVAPVDSGTVSFLFFDEAGNQLTYDQIVNRMTNGHVEDALSEGTFDVDTLRALTVRKSYQKGDAVAVPFNRTGKRQGWMVHWDTQNTGYSSFLLDNGGAGFAKKKTVIFNERLAKDVQRQFNASYLSRQLRLPQSGDYWDLKTSAEACMERLNAASTDSEKGRIGQECVDWYAQAMATMLRDDGKAQAVKLGDDAVWGVSIGDDSLQNYQQKIDDLVDLIPNPAHRWARLIMYDTSDSYFDSIGTLLNYATQKHVKTMGQLFDSSAMGSLSLNTFKKRVNAALNRMDFRQFTAWEVGNEVNGDWLGTRVPTKIAYAVKAIRNNADHKNKFICLTFYWLGMEDSKKTSLFNWIHTKIMKSYYKKRIVNNIDCVTLSVYTDQQPLGFSWDLVMNQLSSLFPGKKVMLGELGYVDPSAELYFGEGKLRDPGRQTLPSLADAYIRARYPAAFSTPVSEAYGGGFWWYYDLEMAGKQNLWHSLHDTYCETYGTC